MLAVGQEPREGVFVGFHRAPYRDMSDGDGLSAGRGNAIDTRTPPRCG